MYQLAIITLFTVFSTTFSATLLYYNSIGCELKAPFSHPMLRVALPLVFLASLVLTVYSMIKLWRKLWQKYMLE